MHAVEATSSVRCIRLYDVAEAEASSMAEVVRTLSDANPFLTKKVEARQSSLLLLPLLLLLLLLPSFSFEWSHCGSTVVVVVVDRQVISRPVETITTSELDGKAALVT